MAQKYTAEVIKKEKVSSKVYCVTFQLVSPSTISFKAGQNMMVMMGEGVNRTMSIASPPQEISTVLMAHDTSPKGLGSQWTESLQIGDHATFVAPTGGVLSLLQTTKRKVLIATGTGIAPFRAIAYDYVSHPNKAPLAVYWGLRYAEDIFWKEEFDKLAVLNPFFTFHLVLSKSSDGWMGDRGHVTEYVFANEKDMANSEFYLCGNKAMIDEMVGKLLEKKVPNEQIKRELFY